MQKTKRILIVDDDYMCRKMLYDLFRHHGFNIRLAMDGNDALECIRKECFDIIITDYMMPGMNGIELTRTIRPICEETFIIGVSSDGVDKEFLSAGADVFMSKPLDIQLIINFVKG